MRREKKSELRVFKLRSGEEIIAKVAGKSRNKIKLQRPMKIVENIQTNPLTGSKRQYVFFTNWLGNTSELVADVPTDFIVVELPPDPDIINMYSRHTEMEDTNKDPSKLDQKNKSLFPSMSEEEIRKITTELDEKLENMLKDMAKEDPMGLSDSVPPVGMGGDSMKPLMNPFMFAPPPFSPNPDSANDFQSKPQKCIMFSVTIPSDVVSAWVESGFIDYLKDSIQDFISTDFLEDMMDEDDEVPQKPKKKKKSKQEKISKNDWKEPSDDKKKKPEFGNSVDDWSPYLKDYFPKKEPPKNKDAD